MELVDNLPRFVGLLVVILGAIYVSCKVIGRYDVDEVDELLEAERKKKNKKT